MNREVKRRTTRPRRWLRTTRKRTILHTLMNLAIITVSFEATNALFAYLGIFGAELSLSRIVFWAVMGPLLGLIYTVLIQTRARRHGTQELPPRL